MPVRYSDSSSVRQAVNGEEAVDGCQCRAMSRRMTVTMSGKLIVQRGRPVDVQGRDIHNIYWRSSSVQARSRKRHSNDDGGEGSTVRSGTEEDTRERKWAR